MHENNDGLWIALIGLIVLIADGYQGYRQYNSKAFPRVFEFQQKLPSCMKTIASNIDATDDHLKWTTIPQDPTLIFYNSTNFTDIDYNEFAVKLPSGEIRNTRDVPYVREPTEPFAIVCIVKSNGVDDLTFEDKEALKHIRALPDRYQDQCVFVTDAISLTNNRLRSLSEMIRSELKNDAKCNDILHRLFPFHSCEIPIRLTLNLEKQLVKRINSDKDTIQQKLEDASRFEDILNGRQYREAYESTLRADPLGPDSCSKFLRAASLQYEWEGDSFTRNKWTVDKVKEKVARYICDELGQQIGKTLMDKFRSDLRTIELKFGDYLLQHVDISDVQQEVYQFIIFAIFAFIWDGVKAFFAVFSTWILGESLNSRSFRYKVADKVLSQIMEHSGQIIEKVLDKFRDVQQKRIKGIKDRLVRYNSVLAELVKSQNMTDCLYHELKVVAKRNQEICAIGYVHGEMSIFAKNIKDNKHSLQLYLSKYLKNADKISIREYSDISIKQFVFQSGDKLEIPSMKSRLDRSLQLQSQQNNINSGREGLGKTQESGDEISSGNSIATVGFYMYDITGRTYAATCRHAILGLPLNALTVISSKGGRFLSDCSCIPSEQLDFSVIRLVSNSEAIEKGIRNKDGTHTYGKIFEGDRFTLPDKMEVYKWGAKSCLTVGRYAATVEVLSCQEFGDTFGESYPFFYFKNDTLNEFAKPGDSGSLICYGSGNDVVAAFMLFGCDDKHGFVGYRIADGISMVRRYNLNVSH